MARGVAGGNPWLGHGVGKKSKRGEAPKRRQWSDAALVKVLSGAYTPRYTDMVGIVGARSLLTKVKTRTRLLASEHCSGLSQTVDGLPTVAGVASE